MSKPLIEIINRKYMKPPPGLKPMKPVDAASIVLMDRRGPEVKILMGRRNPAARFMPGFFVFPGGRIEKTDADAHHSGSLDARDIARLSQFCTRPTARRLRGLALAAVRETFEETGLRIAVKTSTAVEVDPASPWKDFYEGGFLPSIDGMRFFARAITPPGRPRRFDTRFFVRDTADIGDLSTLKPTPDSELVELRWVTLDEAKTLESAEITQMILADLHAQAEAGFEETLPRPLYRARYKRFERVLI